MPTKWTYGLRTLAAAGIAGTLFSAGVWVGHRGRGESGDTQPVVANATSRHDPALVPTASGPSQPKIPKCDPYAGYYDPRFLILAANLEWTEGDAPAGTEDVLMAAYGLNPKDKSNPTADGDEWKFRYAYADLVEGDGQELIVEYRPNGGSGGRSFVFLTKSSNQWKVIAQFLGGFVVMKTPHKFEDLVVYERLGDQYTRVLMKYDGHQHQFVEVSRTGIPRELHDLPSGYIDMWNFFWYLAGDRHGCVEASPGKEDDYLDLYRPKPSAKKTVEDVPIRFHKDVMTLQLQALKAFADSEKIPPISPKDAFAFFSLESRVDWGANP